MAYPNVRAEGKAAVEQGRVTVEMGVAACQATGARP